MSSRAGLQSDKKVGEAPNHDPASTSAHTHTAAPRRLRVAIQQKRFGAKAVLGNVAFDVNAGEIIAVLGASGCGKSTLLRAIAGLDQDWQGAIEIHAANAHRAPIVGVVYQEPRLMPWLTVEENIALALVAAEPAPESNQTQTVDAPNKNTNPSIDGLLQAVYLENARHCLPKQLSGGMAQRVAIARALVRAPDVLLLDEPFSALDILTRRRLISLTREITARFQTATVLVTHDPDEAVRLADRVVVLAHSSAAPGDAAGATICADIRPSADPADKFREVEGIIATLHYHKQAAHR
ncbi:MAG: ABC transporter ATP-binding protein [Rhodocyclaceae bacterium]|nr:ABC transporter ATP-binding protein [Rhodocyclaceae bacterium]MCA3024763.1 ABC transporter ATP-binding protein [Rhodocyclaceae bacterium]MCA3027019.1 ABC transporter ATP-binding protein [Rhodocyclaceae bacterium]MCA3032673.1 ABC transporter ATP-binding protein [Rhodocyclaceae bacterium]MCA3037762.1 ABC transporter ATP-binding protein [Rhodocyclaceae bacterium]